MIVVIIYIVVLAAIFVAIPAGLILIQIKARLFWRLLSVALALVGYCWLCSWISSLYTHMMLIAKVGDSYTRGNNEFVYGIDVLAMEGRTNDIHQACQDYLISSWSENNPTYFEAMVSRTSELAYEQTGSNSTNSHK